MRCLSVFERISHDKFEPNGMKYFCNLAKKRIMPFVHEKMYFSGLQFISLWRTVQSLMREKEVENDKEGEEFNTKEEELFEVEHTQLFYN